MLVVCGAGYKERKNDEIREDIGDEGVKRNGEKTFYAASVCGMTLERSSILPGER